MEHRHKNMTVMELKQIPCIATTLAATATKNVGMIMALPPHCSWSLGVSGGEREGTSEESSANALNIFRCDLDRGMKGRRKG